MGKRGPQTAVDINIAREIRAQGKTYEQIGKVFGVSRERIRQLIGGTGNSSIVSSSNGGHKVPTFDQVMQFVIEAVAAKQREPALKAELEKYKRGYQNMKEHAEAMEKVAKKKANWEKQYQLAVQKGDLPKLDT